MADHKRRPDRRIRREQRSGERRGCHFPIWVADPKLDEERMREMERKLEQTYELVDQR